MEMNDDLAFQYTQEDVLECMTILYGDSRTAKYL